MSFPDVIQQDLVIGTVPIPSMGYKSEVLNFTVPTTYAFAMVQVRFVEKTAGVNKLNCTSTVIDQTSPVNIVVKGGTTITFYFNDGTNVGVNSQDKVKCQITALCHKAPV